MHDMKVSIFFSDRVYILLPSKHNRHNSSSVLGNLQEGGLCQIEMLKRRIAPPTIVIR